MLTRYTKIVPPNSALAHGIAVACIAVAIAIRMLLGNVVGSTAPFVTMFPAVLLATVAGGLWPGLLALALSIIAAWYFFIQPYFSFSPLSPYEIANFILYGFGALLIVIAGDSMRNAVERLETAQEKLLAALGASRTGTWRWDVQKDAIEWDPAMTKVFGLDPADAPRKAEAFFALIHPDDRELARQVIAQAISRGTTAEYEFRAILPDLSERWIYDRSRAVLDGEGRPLYMIGACLDITERKLAEERQTLLVHELNHRVKNTLATVQSLALQTLRGSADSAAFQDNFIARLMALSATHDILTQKLWESASIHEILAAELRPHGGIDQQRIRVEGEIVQLKPKQAVSLGMAFHELATNAVKYGALSTPKGCIRIQWSVEEQAEAGTRHLAIRWSEHGGPPVVPPQHQGFGTRLIDRSIGHELGGTAEIEFAPAGIECLLTVPLVAEKEPSWM